MNIAMELSGLGITTARIDHGARGPEARVNCPFCPDPGVKQSGDALAVNLDSGLWHCHRCNVTGNFFQLKARLRGEDFPHVRHAASSVKNATPKAPPAHFPMARVEVMHSALFTPQGARAYAYLRDKRGFTDETMRHFKLGSGGNKYGPAVAIPYLTSTSCRGVKYRTLDPADDKQRFTREEGYEHPLFNGDALEGEFRAVILTEGEIDAMSLTQYDLGMPVVSLPNGASSFDPEICAAPLVHFDEIFLATDADSKGEEAASTIADKLGAFRCRRVRMPSPHKDANECLVAGVSREDMIAVFQSASAFGVSAVKHISAWRDALLNMDLKQAKGMATGWNALDRLLGGLRAGEMTLLTAETGHGKTSWTVDLARRQARNGVPTLVASLEMPSLVITKKLLVTMAGASLEKLWNEHEVFEQWVSHLCEQPLYVLDRHDNLAVARLKDEIDYATRRFGVKVVIVDHLHYLLGVRQAGEDERLLLDSAACELQMLAGTLQIHVLLVMHPGKIRPDNNGRVRQVEIGDLKGSSGPAQFADNVARIARLPDDQRAMFSLLKVRSEFARLGTIVFAYDPESLRFEDVASYVSGDEKKPPRDHKKAAAGDKE